MSASSASSAESVAALTASSIRLVWTGVVRLTPGGPADKAGIRAGDIIAAVNGTAIADSNALAGALAAVKPGGTATVSVRHPDGSTADVHVVLDQMPG